MLTPNTVLHQLFAECKTEKKFFSHRYLSLRIGLKSSGHILYVMQGKRRLTENVALKIAEFLKFTKRESDYFILLVQYENAKRAEEKQYFFERMALLRKKL
ncbi:MAG: TIGR02147 family protein [Chitinispirillaceae bacterium]|nr:TIGR02147 family protein [Chitinispirillaceae bacterium]